MDTDISQIKFYYTSSTRELRRLFNILAKSKIIKQAYRYNGIKQYIPNTESKLISKQVYIAHIYYYTHLQDKLHKILENNKHNITYISTDL